MFAPISTIFMNKVKYFAIDFFLLFYINISSRNQLVLKIEEVYVEDSKCPLHYDRSWERDN